MNIILLPDSISSSKLRRSYLLDSLSKVKRISGVTNCKLYSSEFCLVSPLFHLLPFHILFTKRQRWSMSSPRWSVKNHTWQFLVPRQFAIFRYNWFSMLFWLHFNGSTIQGFLSFGIFRANRSHHVLKTETVAMRLLHFEQDHSLVVVIILSSSPCSRSPFSIFSDQIND